MTKVTLNKTRLQQCREAVGITKQEAAKRMNMSQPAYLRYESGERTPSIQVIQIMADILETSTDYLTNKTEDPTPTSYYIKASEHPILFEFIKTYKNADKQQQERINFYLNNLNK